MSKPANKTLIGAFVLIAVVLAVAAIVVLGSGKFFKKTLSWVTFFEGSVKGLNVGSPVMFRGVKVGQVTDIIVTFNPTQLSVVIPVLFETDPEKFKAVGPQVITSDAQMHRDLIAKGLRAQLQIQSLVTGQLMINLDFYPDTPVKMHGVAQIKSLTGAKSWWEIPTIPTPMQELEKAISGLNFKEIAQDIKRAMDGIARLAASPDLHESIGVFKQTLIDTQKLVRHLDSKIDPLATRIDQTLVEARDSISDAHKFIIEQGPQLASSIKRTVDTAQTALEQADSTLKSVEDIAEEGSQLKFQISATLKEIAAAARSVRILADFIEQHPDAIIRGRATQTGEK